VRLPTAHPASRVAWTRAGFAGTLGEPVTDVCGRYAPTPSGRLHLGNVRTALLAWLWARALGGRFVMRVEDLDPGRSRAEHERDQLADLRWLGLDWDEGPDVGGPHGPYRQSERGAIYQAALARLDVFDCTCTRRELREATFAPHGREPVYPGTCRHGPSHPERPRAVRWRVPAGPAGTVEVDDAVCGPQREDVAQEAGEFVLRRSDGAWAYQLAVVVDDAAMGITHVLRGADLRLSTARQVLLQRALGLPTPRYAHVPLVLGPDGEKLGKRHGAPELTRLRLEGADPQRVVAVLARSVGLVGDGVARVHPRALVADFDVSRLPDHDTVLELDAL
jgi:glutamyl-tRNA synthetase